MLFISEDVKIYRKVLYLDCHVCGFRFLLHAWKHKYTNEKYENMCNETSFIPTHTHPEKVLIKSSGSSDRMTPVLKYVSQKMISDEKMNIPYDT